MNSIKIVLLALVYFLVLALQSASAEQMPKPYVGSEAFERMKQLAGSWEGSMDMGKGPETIKAHYKITAGGSALVETVFVGAPHEMISVYHDDSAKQLTMTHYCMEGNQPQFVLKSMDANRIALDLAKDAAIDVPHEKHMHAATIQFDDNDNITQQWTGYNAGKEDKVVKISYKRVQ